MKDESKRLEMKINKPTTDGYCRIIVTLDAAVPMVGKRTIDKAPNGRLNELLPMAKIRNYNKSDTDFHKDAGVVICATVKFGRVINADDRPDGSYSTFETTVTIHSSEHGSADLDIALAQYKAQIARTEPIIVHALGALTTDEAEADLLFSSIMHAITPKEVN
jgi:hypothetical protein